MVFFTCTYCGESVKKAAVAKHYQTKCKNNTPFITCVDCLKDFKGNEYEAHIKCYTEEEKYSAKGFVPKSSANKGERKQKAWSECIQAFASKGDLEEDEKKLLEAISKHDNIPRKKGKFINFLNSTARSFINKTDLVDRIWTKLENYFKEVNSESQKNAEMNNGNEKKGETGNNENQKKKRKQDEIAGNDEKNNDGEKQKKKKKKDHSGEESQNGGEVASKGKKKKRQSENEGQEVNGNGEPKSKKAKKSKENGNDKENLNQKQKKDAEKEKSNEEDDADDDDNDAESTFDWNDTIMKIVTKGGVKNPIKMNKLKKKVLKIYGETKGREIDDKMAKKFAKKLNKMDTITVDGEYVTLKSST